MNDCLKQISVNWDFDEISKDLYFANSIYSGGQVSVDYSLSPKYNLICSTQDTCVFLSDAELGQPIFLNNSNNAFLFFKNNGPCNLYFNFSSLPISSGFVDYSCYSSSGVYDFEKCNYLLKKNESAFFTINVDKDGSRYYSKSHHPFGFFYEYKNLNNFICDSSLLISNAFYSDVCSLCFPIYSYEYLSGCSIPINQGSCQIVLCNQGNVKTCNFIENQNLYLEDYRSLVFDGTNYLSFVCDPNSGNYDFFDLSGCFAWETVLSPGNGLVIAKGGGDGAWNGQDGNYFILGFGEGGVGMQLAACGSYVDFAISNETFSTGCFYHLMVASDCCCLYGYINGILTAYLDCSSGAIFPTPTICNCKFVLGAHQTNTPSAFFDGRIRSLKYTTGIFPYTLDVSGNFSYPTGSLSSGSGTLLLIQPREFPKDSLMPHTFSLERYVNSGISLDLIFCKTGNFDIKCEIHHTSNYGLNCISGLTRINCVSLYNQNGLISSNIYNSGHNVEIIDDLNLCLYYNISSSEEKIYNFKYINSGGDGYSNQCIILNGEIYCCNLSGNSILNFSNNSSNNALSCLVSNCGFSIKDIKTKSLNRSNLYLPPSEIFPQSYCFELADFNYSFETGSSGNWCESFVVDASCFENLIELVDINDSGYTGNSPEMFYVDLNFSESRKNTNSLLDKTGALNSESYQVFLSNSENIFTYSGLEYRYNPVDAILYRDITYYPPDINVNIILDVTGKCINFDFPIKALNLRNFKIINDYEVIDIVNTFDSCICYSGFSFNCLQYDSNLICLNFPKIKNENLIGYEAPSVSLNLNTYLKIQNNNKFYINPYSSFSDDLNYGLNNFLFFLISELNNGVVHAINYTGFSYGSSEYNLFMMELKDEFYTCNTIIPSGSGNFLIEEKISFFNYDYSNPIAFKHTGGDGYSYIFPISTGITFFESGYNCCSGEFYLNCKIFNENTNYISCSINFTGGSTGTCILIDEFGNITGTPTGFKEDARFSLLRNNLSLFYNSEDILQSLSGKCICMEKYFTFSGVQPINLSSNYVLSCICSPIKTLELKNYEPLDFDNCTSGVYYYIYNINNFNNTRLKFIAPEGTLISNVCWIDSVTLPRAISSSVSETGSSRIIQNVAMINYDLSNFIYSNPYNYLINSDACICICVIGDI